MLRIWYSIETDIIFHKTSYTYGLQNATYYYTKWYDANVTPILLPGYLEDFEVGTIFQRSPTKHIFAMFT